MDAKFLLVLLLTLDNLYHICVGEGNRVTSDKKKSCTIRQCDPKIYIIKVFQFISFSTAVMISIVAV